MSLFSNVFRFLVTAAVWHETPEDDFISKPTSTGRGITMFDFSRFKKFKSHYITQEYIMKLHRKKYKQ